MLEIPEFEQKIHAYIFSDPKYFNNIVLQNITEDWFAEGASRLLVKVYKDYFLRYKTLPSEDILRNILKRNKFSPDVIDEYAAYLASLSYNDDNNLAFWVDRLKNRYVGNSLIEMGNAITASLKTQKDVKIAYDLGMEQWQKISNIWLNYTPGQDLRDTVDSRIERYELIKNNPDLRRGMLTGLRRVDESMNGFRGGDLCVVVARTGVGKSVALLVIAKNMFMQGLNVLFSSIEITPEMTTIRFDSSMGDLPFDYIRDGCLNAVEEETYRNVLKVQKLCPNHFYLVPQQQARSLAGIRLEIENFKFRHGVYPDAMFIDYVNIMECEDGYLKDHQKQKSIIEDIKQLGVKYDNNVWTAAQQNREGVKTSKKGEVPGPESISLSDYIGNTADFLLFLEETEEDKANSTLSAYIPKARFGEKQTFKLRKNWKRIMLGDDLEAECSDDFDV